MVTHDPTEQAARALEDAGWPSVAEDVRDGIPPHTILRRLAGIGEGDSTAAVIVSSLEADLDHAPTFVAGTVGGGRLMRGEIYVVRHPFIMDKTLASADTYDGGLELVRAEAMDRGHACLLIRETREIVTRLATSEATVRGLAEAGWRRVSFDERGTLMETESNAAPGRIVVAVGYAGGHVEIRAERDELDA